MLPQPHRDAGKISRIPQKARGQYVISQAHLGRAVQVGGEKAGVLRYVGAVHFAKGVWCGVELHSPSGKNNGTVNGVWYFECAPRRGLMAPLNKVALTQAAETPDDGSGPYSILCLDGEPGRTEPLTRDATLEIKRRRIGEAFHMEAAEKPTSLPLPEGGKRDSLDCEESLGILTPDQMLDFTQCSALDYDKLFEGAGQSPTNPEFSFLEANQLSMLKTDTTMNLELSLDPQLARGEETPSPEELPLDTTPIVQSEAVKAGAAKAKHSNSFITSITSITSLDTGYQGDGEMSRPASRGADNSPLTRRPFCRALARRPDPMTDSDFYTESDADNHEDNQALKGDRRAQVIDGTLYGAQAAADVYVNSRENMDSSGVFTDMEGGPCEASTTQATPSSPPPSNAATPTDSSKSASEINSQTKGTEPMETPKKPSGAPKQLQQGEKRPVKKPVNKWDAVMSKISKGDDPKAKLKEVKSKVYETPKPKLVGAAGKRATPSRPRNPAPASLSRCPGSVKKGVQVTQVLTPSELTAKHSAEGKRASAAPKDVKGQKPRKEPAAKGALKGGDKPSRPPPKKLAAAPRATEALAVLVQHLVFNVQAYQVPHLRRQVENYRLEAEQVRLGRDRLAEALEQGRQEHASALEGERQRRRSAIAALSEEHHAQMAQLTSQYGDERLQLEREKLRQSHDEQLATLRKKLQIVQQVHEEVLEILREENECIREQIDEKQLQLEAAGRESAKLQKDYDTKEVQLKAEVLAARLERNSLQQQLEHLEDDHQGLAEENKRLREQNDRLLSYDDKDVATQEVHSLRAVLELKQTELAKLRKTVEEARQRQLSLEGAEERAAALQARCEDLQHQLQRKAEYEQTLIQENQRLQELLANESNHTRRLNQHNEELQWKLRQNNEVIMKVLERTEVASRAEPLERSLSLREATPKTHDLSPPNSPKVKGVVEKSDSVSYVLDLDDSPDLVASRILRRSFRHSTPPRAPPSKSRGRHPLSTSASSSALPAGGKEEGERPRSASARHYDDEEVFLWGSGGTIGITHGPRPDLDEDLDEALPLPALPSEMDKRNGSLALPAPRRLAAEPDSNSEDESTSSSQL